jgi:hypothetical protein
LKVLVTTGARWLQVDQRGAERPDGQPGRDALQGPGRVQCPNAARGQEDCARGRAEDERRDNHWPSAQIVRHRPEEQQRHEQDQDVHRENSGQRGRREMKVGLVHPVQRRRRRRLEEHHQEQPGQDPERDVVTRRPAALGVRPRGPVCRQRGMPVWSLAHPSGFCRQSRITTSVCGAERLARDRRRVLCGHGNELLRGKMASGSWEEAYLPW